MYPINNSYYPYWGIFFVLCSSCIALVHFLKPKDLKWSAKKWEMPPGPAGVPVFGNLLQMMKARRGAVPLNNWLTSLAQYGEMVTLHMGSQTWVMLNSDRVVTELIAKRGKITNERPHMPIASDLISNGKRTVIRQEQEWREGRRVMHQLLSGSSLKLYAGMQELESIDMLSHYLQDPKLWFAHNYRYSTSVLYRIVMGYPLNKTRAQLDDYQRVTIEFFTSINQIWVDFFPAFSKLPHFLQPWRSFYVQMGAFHRHVFAEWWRPIKAAVTNGSAPPSFVRDILLHPDTRYTGNDEEAMYLATSKRAREEVEKVCTDGENIRLPRMSDLSEMPYIAAMIKEVLRWRPTVPIVPPHQLTENLEIDGHFIPAGTSLLINSIALSNEIDNSGDFIPERWIDGTDTRTTHNFWGFGGGRRICVGWRVAEQALFIAFARLLYCFEMAPSGPIDDRELNHQTLNEPFPVKFTVRSPEHAKLIEEEASKYQDSFSTFGATK
ncbi:cytochrome P450 2C31 [Phaeosphaeriaceae sp. PMI808]|nr:cytochrome P450 2C31 [Phaeosphaeriaceae sp. PMI808]